MWEPFAVVTHPVTAPRLVLGERLDRALSAIAARLPESDWGNPAWRGWVATRLLCDDAAIAARIDAGRRAQGALAEAARQRAAIEAETGLDAPLYVTERYYGFVDGLLREVVTARSRADARATSDAIDAVLAHRLLDTTIAELPVLSRWLAAALLGGAAWALRHHRRSPLHGRAALVFWLLVLVLHLGPAPLEATTAHGGELWLVLPTGAASGLAFELLRAPVGRLPPAAEGTADLPRRPRHRAPLRPLAAGLTPAPFSLS